MALAYIYLHTLEDWIMEPIERRAATITIRGYMGKPEQALVYCMASYALAAQTLQCAIVKSGNTFSAYDYATGQRILQFFTRYRKAPDVRGEFAAEYNKVIAHNCDKSGKDRAVFALAALANLDGLPALNP